MIAPFTRIVVDKKEEAKFRRRAMRQYPMEHIEALWGQIRGDILYVCAFVKVDVTKKTIRSLYYDEQEMDFHAEDAREAGLHFLGTIHSHPNCEDTAFSEHDLRDSQGTDELVMGICTIQKERNERKKCEIAYWPTVRPLITIRKEAEEIKKPYKKGKKAARRKR